MMRTQLAHRKQLKLHWEDDHRMWRQLPETQRSLSQELLSLLLRALVEAEANERRESDERENHSHAS
jgi:hypothetical protein